MVRNKLVREVYRARHRLPRWPPRRWKGPGAHFFSDQLFILWPSHRTRNQKLKLCFCQRQLLAYFAKCSLSDIAAVDFRQCHSKNGAAVNLNPSVALGSRTKTELKLMLNAPLEIAMLVGQAVWALLTG